MMFAPPKAQIIDTWSVNGLRGTGSHDIAVENLVVPADDTFDIFLGQSVRPGSVDGGAAALRRAAYRHRRDRNRAARASPRLSHSPTPTSAASTRARRSPRVRSFSFEWDRRTRVCAPPAIFCAVEADAVWNSAVAGNPISIDGRAPVMAAITWAVHTCAAVVDSCYKAGGGTSPYDGSPLQRCMRDIQTLTQHAAVAESWLTTSGARHTRPCERVAVV